MPKKRDALPSKEEVAASIEAEAEQVVIRPEEVEHFNVSSCIASLNRQIPFLLVRTLGRQPSTGRDIGGVEVHFSSQQNRSPAPHVEGSIFYLDGSVVMRLQLCFRGQRMTLFDRRIPSLNFDQNVDAHVASMKMSGSAVQATLSLLAAQRVSVPPQPV